VLLDAVGGSVRIKVVGVIIQIARVLWQKTGMEETAHGNHFLLEVIVHALFLIVLYTAMIILIVHQVVMLTLTQLMAVCG